MKTKEKLRTIFKVAYMPLINNEDRKRIIEEIEVSLECFDSETNQYNIEKIMDNVELYDLLEQETKNILEILKEKDVDYIEI